MNEKHKEEILKIEKNNKNLINKNSQSDLVLNELNEKIKQYEEKLKNMDIELNKSKKKIEEKELNLKEVNLIVSQKDNENKLLNNNINVYKNEIKDKKKELDELNKNNLEIRAKGKDILNRYNEVIMRSKEEIIKNKEEINLLNNKLSENDKKIEKIDLVIKELENENNALKDKISRSQKTINEYLETITLLHQQNLSLEKEKKEISFKKEELEKKVIYMFEPFSNSINKSSTLNSSYTGVNSKEHLQLKKEHENLKRNYEELIKNIEPNKELNISKVKKIQDLSDKLTLFSKEINEYKNVVKISLKKIGGIININVSSNYDLKDKLESVIVLVIDTIHNKNEEIKNLKEQKEILLNNLKTNSLKKDLFEFLNSKKNKNDIDKKDLSDKISKIREGYQIKNLNFKSQNRELSTNYELLANKENNNNLNFSQIKRK